MLTKVEYLYRDASNYKAFGQVILSGCLSDADWRLVTSRCDSGDLFVAEQIGILSVATRLQRGSQRASEDDHGWHELIGFDVMGPALQKTYKVWGTATEFVDRFARVAVWNLSRSPFASA